MRLESSYFQVHPEKRTKMFLTICAGFVALICESLSFMLNYLIEKYLKKKLQGQQTPLDQAIIDCTRVWNTRTVVSDVCFFSGLLYGQLSFDWALPLLWTQCFLIYLMISTVQMVLVIKVIMIFNHFCLFLPTDEPAII